MAILINTCTPAINHAMLSKQFLLISFWLVSPRESVSAVKKCSSRAEKCKLRWERESKNEKLLEDNLRTMVKIRAKI
jgi:hypothetical protein